MVDSTEHRPETEQTRIERKLHKLRDTLMMLEAQRLLLAQQALHVSPGEDNKQANEHDVVTQALTMAKATNQEHIRSLTQYNELKDIGTSLIGMIADNRQKRIIEVMEELGVNEKD